MKDQDANIPLTRFEQSFGGHVPVGDDGNDGDDDDDACSPPRSVFSIFVDCLDSQMVGTDDKMDVESQVRSEAEGNVENGESCDDGRDQDMSHRDSSNVLGATQRRDDDDNKQDWPRRSETRSRRF